MVDDDDVDPIVQMASLAPFLQDLASSRADGLPAKKRNELIRIVTELISENPASRKDLASYGGACSEVPVDWQRCVSLHFLSAHRIPTLNTDDVTITSCRALFFSLAPVLCFHPTT